MDFAEAQRIAQKWVTSSSTRFELIDSDSVEKKLTFATSLGNESFYIVGPNRESGSISWHIWSDNSDVLTKLYPVIESLQSCTEKTLQEILNSINRTLAASLGGAAAIDAEEDEGLADDDDDEDDDDDDYDDDYYGDEDVDAITETETNAAAKDDDDTSYDMYTSQGSPTAVKRLLKDWKNMKGVDKFSISACPRGDNLFLWDVKLKDFPQKTKLGRDLHEYSKRYRTEAVILMEMTFPADYPMAPPFVRILKPRFQALTGHVTIGGSICMELLTKSGWRPTNDIENILIQIRAEIMSDQNASLDIRNPNNPYDKVEAERAFQRMVQRYGWNR